MSTPQRETTPNRGRKLWWEDAVVYQLYPRSFADSNGDGIGDFEGIRSHLDHVRDLGANAIWLSPCFPSPQADHGYDVADYFDIEPDYGTLADFDRTLAEAKERGIRIMLDIVPNHCSSDHAWFQAALKAAPGSPELPERAAALPLEAGARLFESLDLRKDLLDLPVVEPDVGLQPRREQASHPLGDRPAGPTLPVARASPPGALLGRRVARGLSFRAASTPEALGRAPPQPRVRRRSHARPRGTR
jgi:hypothetical protein